MVGFEYVGSFTVSARSFLGADVKEYHATEKMAINRQSVQALPISETVVDQVSFGSSPF